LTTSPSLAFDREHKGSLHPSAPSGWRYRSVETRTPPAVVVPLALPSTPIAVADLLP